MEHLKMYADMKIPPKINVGVREMTRNDLSDVVRIERNSSGDRWCLDDFKKRIGSKKFGAAVAFTDEKEVVGFVCYQKYKSQCGSWHVGIERLAVDKEFRRHGIGSQVLWILIDRNSKIPGFHGVEAIINEREVGQQLFLKQCGFECNSVAKGIVGGEGSLADDDLIFNYDVAKGD